MLLWMEHILSVFLEFSGLDLNVSESMYASLDSAFWMCKMYACVCSACNFLKETVCA